MADPDGLIAANEYVLPFDASGFMTCLHGGAEHYIDSTIFSFPERCTRAGKTAYQSSGTPT
jgi:hypothetical protein